jgi:hypothetical protein
MEETVERGVELDRLRRMRDELRVKMHLGSMEAKERFEEIEKRWHHLEGRLKVIGQEGKESLGEIGEAARQLMREIREGYEHIRRLV